MKQDRVVFDLDGTLALNDHRKHLVECDEPDWPAFYAACHNDHPNWPVVTTLMAMKFAGFQVWILTGRSDEVADKTILWLRNNKIHFDRLIMRAEGDFSPDTALKAGWAEVHNLTPENTLAVYDDRDSVVAMWRERGMPCFQVAPGSF